MPRSIRFLLLTALVLALVVWRPIALASMVMFAPAIFLGLGVFSLAQRPASGRSVLVRVIASASSAVVAALAFRYVNVRSSETRLVLRYVLPALVFCVAAWWPVRTVVSFSWWRDDVRASFGAVQRWMVLMFLPLVGATYFHLAFYHLEVFDDPFDSATGIAIRWREDGVPLFVLLGIVPPFLLLRCGARALAREIAPRGGRFAMLAMALLAVAVHVVLCDWHVTSFKLADDYTNAGMLYVMPRRFGRSSGLAPPGVYAALGRRSVVFAIGFGILLPMLLVIAAWFARRPAIARDLRAHPR